MSPYIFTAAAERDVYNIAFYTKETWGQAQSHRYIAKLEKGIAALAEGRIRFKEFGGTFYPLRRAHIEHHYVFMQMREDSPAIVVAILHERSDYMRRLAVRIQPNLLAAEKTETEV